MAFSKKAKERLKVTFPDGKTFCMLHPKDTVIAVLKEIGSQRFGEINLERNKRPLIAREIFPELKNYMREVCDGWYLNCQSDTDEKFLQLSLINKALNLNLSIEKGDFSDIYTTKSPKAANKSKRPKSRLRVTLEDGAVIEEDACANVLIELIRRLGVNEVAARHISWAREDLITTTNTNGRRVEIGDMRWLILPNNLKDAMKLIKILASNLRVKIEVETVEGRKTARESRLMETSASMQQEPYIPKYTLESTKVEKEPKVFMGSLFDFEEPED